MWWWGCCWLQLWPQLWVNSNDSANKCTQLFVLLPVHSCLARAADTPGAVGVGSYFIWNLPAGVAVVPLTLCFISWLFQVADGNFTWDVTNEEPSLRDINFEAAPGSLTMVVGSVGSGKSSLLAALIGQMEGVSGSVAVGGNVAYVAQTAWIVNDSVQV
jgi:ABC-type multidrug transport system fused ATPase/permease subunit